MSGAAETIRRLVAVAGLLCAAGTAGAFELTLNLGQDDALDRSGTGTLAAGVELRTDPMASPGRFEFGLGSAIEADGDGDVWLGFGPFGHYGLARGFRLEASIMAGAYSRGNGDDLGSPVEFRSRIGISKAVGPTWRIGLAGEHKSNGGVGAFNPGVETVFVTVTRGF